MELKNIKASYVKIFIVALYFFGWLGATWSVTRKMFIELTPISLLVGAGILFAFHRQKSQHHVGVFLLVLLGSFLLESIGVWTGYIFGSYRYGEALGFKLLGTPFLIGLNWLMLIYTIYTYLQRWNLPSWIRSAAGALVMVGYDLLMEPVAPKLDFWYWAGNTVPLQNYMAWWLVSFIFFMTWERLQVRYDNPMSVPLFVSQSAFFLLLNITLV